MYFGDFYAMWQKRHAWGISIVVHLFAACIPLTFKYFLGLLIYKK
jgi:hypothetical protein